MSNFKELGINDKILSCIDFDKPTEVQEKTIPPILEGKDVVAGSATGSGKTLAFAAGIIERCEPGQHVQALVLTPTRELAEQVKDSIKKFSKGKKLKVTAIYGGVSINPQIENLKKADVVIATPGRMLDHMERRTVDLSNIKVLVLDEADRMLDMGFLPDVKRILKVCPRERQTLFFSATISPETEHLTEKYMKNPVNISATPQVDPKKLRQVYYDVPDNIKFSLLVHLLENEDSKLVMVFCNSRRTTDFVADNLKLNGIHATAIHGGFTQDKRGKTLDNFNNDKKTDVLVCTDVASRGLDITGVSHVYNYDLPKDHKQYVHRIGRTARAGKEGIAVNLLSPRDHDNFTRILRFNDVEVENRETPYVKSAKVKKSPERKGFGKNNFHKNKTRGGKKNGRHR